MLFLIFSKAKPSSFNKALSLIKDSLAWQWSGWKTVVRGLLAFILGFVLLFPVVNTLVGSYPFPYNNGSTGPITMQQWYLLVLSLSLVRYRSKSMIPTVIAHGLGWIYVVMGTPIG